MVRTSTSILGSLERALTSPSWAASTIWYYPVFVRTWPLRRPAGTAGATGATDVTGGTGGTGGTAALQRTERSGA